MLHVLIPGPPPPSLFPTASACINCQAGTISTPGTSVCTLCAAGQYSVNTTACGPCTAGKYTPNSGLSTCLDCGVGLTSGPGASSCARCPTGRVLVNGVCTFCTPGSVPDAASVTCVACTGISFSADPSNPCTNCPPGFVPNTNRTACTACPAGTSYQAVLGTCVPCGVGLVSRDAGSTVCTACNPGFIPNAIKTGCVPCARGFQPGTGAQADICTQCPAGKYANQAGLATCLDCSPGQYSDTQSSFCSDCPMGTFASLSGSAQCAPCPVDSPLSSWDFTTCEALPLSPGSSPSRTPSRTSDASASPTPMAASATLTASATASVVSPTPSASRSPNVTIVLYMGLIGRGPTDFYNVYPFFLDAMALKISNPDVKAPMIAAVASPSGSDCNITVAFKIPYTYPNLRTDVISILQSSDLGSSISTYVSAQALANHVFVSYADLIPSSTPAPSPTSSASATASVSMSVSESLTPSSSGSYVPPSSTSSPSLTPSPSGPNTLIMRVRLFVVGVTKAQFTPIRPQFLLAFQETLQFTAVPLSTLAYFGDPISWGPNLNVTVSITVPYAPTELRDNIFNAVTDPFFGSQMSESLTNIVNSGVDYIVMNTPPASSSPTPMAAATPSSSPSFGASTTPTASITPSASPGAASGDLQGSGGSGGSGGLSPIILVAVIAGGVVVLVSIIGGYFYHRSKKCTWVGAGGRGGGCREDRVGCDCWVGAVLIGRMPGCLCSLCVAHVPSCRTTDCKAPAHGPV